MKKIMLALALVGFMGTAAVPAAVACEGGKCKMEHKDEATKAKKGKKEAAKNESCEMSTAEATKSSCCMNKGTAATSNTAKPANADKSQQ